MNAAWHRIVKLVYRKEPISGTIAIAGAADIAIGGLEGSASLLVFGVVVVAAAATYRTWLSRQRIDRAVETVSDYYLPPSPSSTALPDLAPRHKRSSR